MRLRSISSFIFWTFVIAIFSKPVIAQSESGIFIGPIGAYNGVEYLTNAFGPPGSLPGFEMFENGSGGTWTEGISAIIPLFTHFQHFIVLEVAYDSKSARFASMVNGTSYKIGTISFLRMTPTLDYLLLNIGYKFNFSQDSLSPNGFGVTGCISVGKTLASKFTTAIYDTENIYSGSSGPIQNGTTVTNIDGVYRYRLAIRGELSYDVPIASRWLLTPFVGDEFPLTKVDRTNRNWIAKSVYAGMALRYRIR